jgi:mono/diheme cytochrome c family protein
MNLWILGFTILGLALLYWRKVNLLAWAVTWWVVVYVNLGYGMNTPIPQSVLWLYMGITAFVLILYVTSDDQRLTEVIRPLVAILTERKYALGLILVIMLVPGLVAASVYLRLTAPASAPLFGRTVHPAPPDEISVGESKFNLTTLQNPLRQLEDSNPEAFRQHVESGRSVYYQNCFYCHGDVTAGKGVYADALNPVPTNLVENIPLLQESFLFWRIAKGGPGLPDEGGPWDSAMPAWEEFLTEEEIWEVILFLYDFNGTRPRAREELHE